MLSALPQEGTPVIPAFDAAVAAFNQLHNSLNGGSAGQGGIDDVPPPGPPVDPEPLLAPYPLLFGPVTVLQKFAVISSIQNTPVIGAGVEPVAPPCGSRLIVRRRQLCRGGRCREDECRNERKLVHDRARLSCQEQPARRAVCSTMAAFRSVSEMARGVGTL